jgi:phage-related protein
VSPTLGFSVLSPPVIEFDSMPELAYSRKRIMTATSMRPLRFIGDSLKVLRELPEEVKDEIGFALERVQRGRMPENAKPLKGIAPGVLEIVSDFRGDTFRAVYTVRFPKAVYVLHVFQKKSKRGIATPKHEIELVERRLAQVVELEKRDART